MRLTSFSRNRGWRSRRRSEAVPRSVSGVCGSRTRVELDHIVPVALGGESTKSNVRLLCAFHDGVAARQVFGAQLMDRYTSRGRSGGPASAPAPDPVRPRP
ncbi:MAG: HNH endonuclease [Anaeromyxobacteraceae bacterium]